MATRRTTRPTKRGIDAVNDLVRLTRSVEFEIEQPPAEQPRSTVPSATASNAALWSVLSGAPGETLRLPSAKLWLYETARLAPLIELTATAATVHQLQGPAGDVVLVATGATPTRWSRRTSAICNVLYAGDSTTFQAAELREELTSWSDWGRVTAKQLGVRSSLPDVACLSFAQTEISFSIGRCDEQPCALLIRIEP